MAEPTSPDRSRNGQPEAHQPLPLSVWPTAQQPTAAQRAGRYLPASTAHPAKMLPAIARHAITAYSKLAIWCWTRCAGSAPPWSRPSTLAATPSRAQPATTPSTQAAAGIQARPIDPKAGLPEMLTVKEVAATVRVGRNQLYQAVARGELRAVRIGRTIHIPKATALKLLTSPPAKPDATACLQ